MRRLSWLCAALLFAAIGPSVAEAQPVPAADICFRCGGDTIYGLTSLITYLEANPDVDDAYKGPIITWAQAKIFELRATAGPVHPVSPTPCCYSRKPLHLR